MIGIRPIPDLKLADDIEMNKAIFAAVTAAIIAAIVYWKLRKGDNDGRRKKDSPARPVGCKSRRGNLRIQAAY